MARKLKGVTTGQVLLMAFLTILAIFMALPLVYLVVTAFKPTEELFLFPPRFWVKHPTMDNFLDLLMATSGTAVPFSRYIFNSVFVSCVTVVGSVMFASMAAYPLAKHKVPGREVIFTVIVSALMFAPEVTQIPRYLIVNKLGMIDTYWALIVPALAAPMGLFLMKQFLGQIPDVLIEAGKIDGASEWDVFTKIMMPNCKPAWTTILFLTFVAIWNDTWGPMVFMRSDAMKTLPLALQTLNGGLGVVARAGAVNAAAFLTTMPTIILFVFVQSRVLQTMTHSGIKA